jgi:hypothetical protein
MLRADGAPPGVDISFSKNLLNPEFTSVMTIYASNSAAAGNYTITITGTSGNLNRWATIEIEVAKVLFPFILETKTDIINSPLTGVKVNIGNDIRYTREHTEYVSNTVYGLLPKELYYVSVEDPFNSRFFSHFRDFDCDGLGNISDTANNPYKFNMSYKDRIMTAFYKVFTQIRNLEFDNVTSTISGNLLDEDFNPIIKNTTKYDTCGVPIQVYPNRNVTIEYLDACTNSWKPIGSVASSLASISRFYDNFDKGDYNKWITTPTWNVTNGELNNTGTGDEMAQTKWNYWNGSAGDNSNLEISVKILSGSNISIKIFDSINDYYLQTNDSYNNLYLWVNGALKQNVALTGINPNQWNTWMIKQNESYIEFYLNDKELIRYSGVPLMNFGRVMIETLNTKAAFDNITAYDGSWSYHLDAICSMKKIKAEYVPTDWYYNGTSSDIDIDPMTVPCKLMVNTQIDIPTLPLPGVEVNVTDGVTNTKYNKITTGPLATAVYFLASSFLPVHNITVEDVIKTAPRPTSFSTFSQFGASVLNPENAFDDGFRDTSTYARLDAAAPIISLAFINLNFSGVELNSSIYYTWLGGGGVGRYLRLWDYSTGKWDPTSIGTAPLSLTTESYQITNSKYIQNGNLRAQFFVVGLGFVATFMNVSDVYVGTLSPRNFSHFYDWDCDPANENRWLDTANNPYWFSICRDKNITVQYKTFTNITNTSGAPNTFNFDFHVSPTISGYLLDEYGKPIINRNGTKHSTCTPPSIYDNITINRNVTLEYFKKDRWYYINATDSLPNGYWKYDWGCVCNATKLRANYTPIGGNWYYMPNSTVIDIVCPCKLTVFAQVDAYDKGFSRWPLSPVKVNVSNKINWTDSNGYAVYYLFPGTYYINVDNPFNSRPFSHFFDSDCNRVTMNYWLDNASNPYDFGMYDREKNITAQYKAFTFITDSNNTRNIFGYNGTTIKGKLLDERNGAITTGYGYKRSTCEDPVNYDEVHINRNVTLEVFNSSDNKWYLLGVVDSLADGNWSYDWTWTSGITKIRVNYTPSNWYYVGTSAEISLYRLILYTKLDMIGEPPVKDVNVNLDGITKSSGTTGKVEFMLTSGVRNILVDSITNNRPFSHYWDHNCSEAHYYEDWYNDTSDNPFTFTAYVGKDREITAYYKVFTNITNTIGTDETFDYDGSTIKGKLLKENGDATSSQYHRCDGCTDSSLCVVGYWDRNVSLEYYKCYKGVCNWYSLGSVKSDAAPGDGSWSRNWICECNTTKIRATFNPTATKDWYYNYSDAEKTIDPSLCPCKLTVFAQIDAFSSPLSPLQVTVDALPTQTTDVSGKTEFMIKPGSHTVTSINPFIDALGLRQFSHFWDSDCNKNNIGYYLDNASNPYDFGMYDREKNITAQYKAFTKITNSIGTVNTFDFDGSKISGKLLNERDGAISAGPGYKRSTCEDPVNYEEVHINRNVTLEVFNSSDSKWYPIGVNDSLADGTWSYNWIWTPGMTKIRANYTPLPENWGYMRTSAEISLYRLILYTKLDMIGEPPVNVQVTLDGKTKPSGATGKVEFMLTSGVRNILVDSIINNRPFSHYWDHNCSEAHYYDQWYNDTSDNPYKFTAYVGKDREITAYYKVFTNITDSAGTPNTFDYDGSTIKGKLLKENGDATSSQYHRCDGCTDSSLCVVGYWDRNVSLEYSKDNGLTWNYLTTVKSNAAPGDGSWSYDWTCVCGTNKLRATFNPTATKDWYYNYTSVEKIVGPSLCPCKLLVFTDLDTGGFPNNPPVPFVNVNVSGVVKPTNASGIAEFDLIQGLVYSINVDDPFMDVLGPRPFSHFWDHDCNDTNAGLSKDTESNPYTFTMHGRERDISAFYKTFTKMNNLNYNSGVISGKLQNESNAGLYSDFNRNDICGSLITGTWDRNVTLEFLNSTDSTWKKIDTVKVSTYPFDGSWSYPWSCVGEATKIRANYTSNGPKDWYYASNSTDIPISCMGTLDVYAFVGANQVGANVSIGLGDVDWDGNVDNDDLWFFNTTHNPNNCYNTKPGDARWNIDCDMNLDNVIDITDAVTVAGQFGKSIPINTTHFTMNIDPGTYQLRAKYNNQIKNNLSVVINPGQTTRVDFNFLSCDGFTALICTPPAVERPGFDVRNLTGNCGRTNAKIDCDGNYNSHKVCNLGSPSSCALIEPTINSYSVSKTNIVVGESFSINVNGNCPHTLPNDLPGSCGIECRVKHPDGHNIELDTWSNDGSGVLPSVTCDQAGNYIVDYCVIATDFAINRGWGNGIWPDTIVSCTAPNQPPIASFTESATKVKVGDTINFDASGSSDPDGVIVSYNWDFGDATNGVGAIVNHAYSNPGTYTVTLTVTDDDGATKTASATKIVIRCSGDISVTNDDITCGSTDFTVTVTNTGSDLTADITDELWKDVDCNSIRDTEAVAAKTWSNVPILAGQTITKSWSTSIANNPSICYIHSIWFCSKPLDASNPCWVGSSRCDDEANSGNIKVKWNEKEFKCGVPPQCSDGIDNDGDGLVDSNDPGCHSDGNTANPASYDLNDNDETDYLLTFEAQVDGIEQPLQGVQVNVNGMIKNTLADGTVTYRLPAGLHTISVQSQSGSRIFSHFWDHDCDNFGNYYDTSGSPFGTYTFTMFNKDKNITAQYLTFTKITDTIGNPNTFEYDGTTIKGKLLDEKNNVLFPTGGKAPTCGGLGTRIPIDTNITLEYYDGSWHPISTTKLYDDFNDGNYNGWTVGSGTWSVTNGELSDSGSGGAEYINTNWNGWNSNDYVSVNIKLSGVDIWVKIFDGSNEYYFQTWDGYNTLHLYVNGVNTKSAALAGISPSNWNTWKIKQVGSTIEIYINDQKWMDYDSAPIITNGRIQLRTSNPTIGLFDDVNVDGIIYKKDGSWSYSWSCVPVATKLRASYNPLNWYYKETSAVKDISCPSACGAYDWQFPSSSVASSEYSSPYTASKCIDSNTGTDWYSLEGAPPAVYHWIQFNLGSKKCISGTRVEIPAIDTPLTIKVDVSNDTVTWTNIISDWSITTDTETWVENYFAETNGHYIRLNYTQLSRPNPYGTCREFQAYTANSH